MLGSAPSLLFSRSVAELNTFALLTNSLVMMMLLVQGPPHFENYCSRAISCEAILSFWMISSVQTIYFFKDFFYLFWERREGREEERETNITVWEKHQFVASPMQPNWGLGHNPGKCPDWEPNRELLLFWMALNQLSHSSRAYSAYFRIVH